MLNAGMIYCHKGHDKSIKNSPNNIFFKRIDCITFFNM
jgi:hypothetical protein